MKGPIILARNIDCKSILQKTLEQFGLAASKYRQNWDSRAIFSAPHFADEFAGPAISREMFLQSAFQLGFLPSKPCLFPLKSSLEFVLYRGRKRESTSCFARRLSFFPAPCMGACLQAKKEIGTGTDRTGRLSWERTKELLQRVSGR